MRKPTSAAEALSWWRAAMLNPRHPMIATQPQCGWYKLRFVKNGPWIPVRIYLDRHIDEHGDLMGDERHMAVIGREDPKPATRVWSRCRPITRTEYEALVINLDRPQSAATHAPVQLHSEPIRRPT